MSLGDDNLKNDIRDTKISELAWFQYKFYPF